MRCCEDHVAHNVVGLHLGAAYATATTALGAERIGAHCLDVLSLCHHDHKFFVINKVFNAKFANVVGDGTYAWCCKSVAHGCHFFADYCAKLGVRVEDCLQFFNSCKHIFLFSFEIDA